MPQRLFSTTQIPQPAWIDSDGSRVYLGSANALSLLDVATGARTQLIGESIDPDPSAFGLGVVERPSEFWRSGDWLYFHSWGYRIQRLFMPPDGKGTIDEVVLAAGLLVSSGQLEDFTADAQRLYWALSSGDTNRVYARSLAGGEAQLTATVSGEARLTIAGSQLYIATVTPMAGPAVRVVDLTTGAVDTIQEGVSLAIIDGEMPRAASETRFFWMDGTTLRSVAHGARSPEVVATGLARVRRLATDGVSVYALQEGPPQDAILRIDLATGAVTPVVARDDIRALLVYQGELWWVSGLVLEASSPDGSGAAARYASDGVEIVFGGAGNARMAGVSGRVVVASGEQKLLVHDPVAGTSSLLSPLVGGRFIASDASTLYAASDLANVEGIARIPVDVPLRAPETLLGGLATIDALFLDQDWLYWSEWSSFGGVYRISRMRTDGTGLQVLFDGDHHHLAIHEGRLFFACEAACSLSRWMLVSMPLAGGTITPEATLGAFPQQILVRNGLFYVLDTADGVTFGVWAIDLAGRRAAQVVQGLPLTGITIDASPKWLYVWTAQCPDRACGVLDRRPIESWDRLGAPQLVDPGEGIQKSVYAFRSDGTNLYYWLQDEGLKALAE